MRGAKLGGIDFGGAEFSCMNTSEGKPSLSAVFKNIEFEYCKFQNCSL